MAEHHTCDRCGDPIEHWLEPNTRTVWVGHAQRRGPEARNPMELDLKCLHQVEQLVYGRAITGVAVVYPGQPDAPWWRRLLHLMFD